LLAWRLAGALVFAGCHGTSGDACPPTPTAPFGVTCPRDAHVGAVIDAPTGPDPYQEAIVELGRLGEFAKANFNSFGAYTEGSSAQIPASTCCQCVPIDPDAGVCTVDSVCPVSQQWTSDPIWSALGFQVDHPTRFLYSYVGLQTSFTADAVGDLDCDGVFVTYELDGIVLGGQPSITLTVPAQGTD
jgi:hypothetical protein